MKLNVKTSRQIYETGWAAFDARYGPEQGTQGFPTYGSGVGPNPWRLSGNGPVCLWVNTEPTTLQETIDLMEGFEFEVEIDGHIEKFKFEVNVQVNEARLLSATEKGPEWTTGGIFDK